MAEREDAQLALFDEAGESFEEMAKTNGSRYWMARSLMRLLGYDNWAAFKKVVNKAIGVCTTTGISVADNFIQYTSIIGGREVEDFKLTRLACCLTTMNGDEKNPNITRAQLYFAALDQVLQDSLLHPENMDRIMVREEISEREVTLSQTAAAAGVVRYGSFQNAGYRGMYNMDLTDLKRLKGIPDMRRSLLGFMGKDELAGNLFRLTLTEGRIKKEGVRGQAALEHVATVVGSRVRQAMIDETGMFPERLPITPDIRTVKKNLKDTDREFTQLDDLERQRIYEAEAIAELEATPIPDRFTEPPIQGAPNVSPDQLRAAARYLIADADIVLNPQARRLSGLPVCAAIPSCR